LANYPRPPNLRKPNNIPKAHHDGEEKVFFPEIRKKVAVPDKTAADHKALLKALAEISTIGKFFVRAAEMTRTSKPA